MRPPLSRQVIACAAEPQRSEFIQAMVRAAELGRECNRLRREAWAVYREATGRRREPASWHSRKEPKR